MASTAGKANWNDRPISSCSQASSKASTSGQAAGKPSGSCSEGSEGYGGFEGARRQSRKRKKELCARLQQMERPLGFARGGPQLE